MIYLCLLLSIVPLLLSLRKNRNLHNPDIYMYGLWSFIVFLNFLRLYGINETLDEVYLMVILGNIGYGVGSVIASNTNVGNIKLVVPHLSNSKNTSWEINYKFVYMLALGALLFMLIDFAIAVNALFHGASFVELRTWIMSTFDDNDSVLYARRSYAEQVIRVLVVSPVQFALTPLAFVDFFFGKKNKSLLIFAIAFLALSTISGGGARLGIVLFVFSFVIAASIGKKNIVTRLNVIKKNKKIYLLAILGFVVVIVLTSLRTSSSFFREAYYYFALCLPLLSSWFPIIKNYSHTGVMMSLFGGLRVPNLILQKLGLFTSDLYERSYNYIINANQFRSVGNKLANSFVSPYYYFYIDAGYVGCFVGMLLVGLFANVYYKKVKCRYDERDIYILMMIILGIIYFFMRFELATTNYFFALLYIPLFFKRKKYKNQMR